MHQMKMLPRGVLVIVLVIQLIVCESQQETTSSDVEATTEATITTTSRKLLRSRGSVKYGMVLKDPSPFRRNEDANRDDGKTSGEDMSLEDTVFEVEKYLKSHPELPKLSREEIIGYINNISEPGEDQTKATEMTLFESSKTTGGRPQTSRENGERSIMVVYPVKPENEDIEEFLTKSPLVKMLDGEAVDMDQQWVTEEVSPEPKIFAYPVYKATSDDYATTTDPTVRSYTNYNDAEMVTKRYYFEESKTESGMSNHRYEETSTVVVPEERLKSAIVVLPMKNNESTIKPLRKPKPVLRKRVKTTTEKATPEPDSLENFGFDDVTTTTAKPVKMRKESKRKTTEGPPTEKDLSKVMEILPSDMKVLLSDLGLNDNTVIANASEKEQPPMQPNIDPSSYSAFKPIPVARKSEKFFDDGMKDFLASFGLVPDEVSKSRRRDKALEPPKFIEEVPDISLEIIPEDMRHVLHNLGLTRQPKAKQSRDHIFNPSNPINQSEEEEEKLKALMSSVKKIVSLNESEPVSPELQYKIIQQIQELDNLTLKYKNRESTQINDEIKQIIITNKDKFNFVTLYNITNTMRRNKKLENGPDPLFMGDGELKNEVKRQVSSDSGNSSSTNEGGSSSSSTTASSDSETTTEEPPNIEGLRASFGGGETAPDDADIDSALPPKKPNGLYLLLDWNSFLEVGTEDDKRRVNIRFQPKIGDARHFIPVTIP